MKNKTFAKNLSKWKLALKHKERAALLGVPLDTFRGWLYGKAVPSDFARKTIEEIITKP